MNVKVQENRYKDIVTGNLIYPSPEAYKKFNTQEKKWAGIVREAEKLKINVMGSICRSKIIIIVQQLYQ